MSGGGQSDSDDEVPGRKLLGSDLSPGGSPSEKAKPASSGSLPP